MATSVDAKLLKQTKFPVEFSQKVDMKKVNVEVMKKSGCLRPLTFKLVLTMLAQMDRQQDFRDTW